MLFYPVEDGDLACLSGSVGEHPEIEDTLCMLHVFHDSFNLFFAIVRLASYLPKVLQADARGLVDEVLGPDVLDQRVREELLSSCSAVFSEDLNERCS